MNREISLFTKFSAVCAVIVCLAIGVCAQSVVSGDITGTVADPTGAVIAGAQVTLTSVDTHQTQSGTTNSAGVFRFALLKPGRYTIAATHTGFGTVSQNAAVAVGQITRADFKLALGTQSQIVEVTAEAPLLQADNGNTSSSFNTAEIESSFAPGGDITTIAELAPGIMTNTSSGGGYGNFTSNGLPGTANLFTVNGNDEMDPFLNLNNSGASNLSLGSNELSEATVTTNGYTGQFGRNAGAQINYATKSGANRFHGNGIYNWSGAAVNARDWFTNDTAPNTHDHQWAASVGGPIWKDKTFFFVDTEGIKYTLPTSNNVFIPSPAYQASTLLGLAGSGQEPFYQSMFDLWNNAPGATNKVICNDPTSTTCDFNVSTFHNSVTNSAHEWILIGRVDHQFTSKDKAFFRFKEDHGLQPTYTDPINPIFNAQSVQPAYEGQANFSHTLSNTAVNQLILSGSYYSAIFKPSNPTAAKAAFPYAMAVGVGPFTNLGGENYVFPQGRNVSQYQIVDDFTITRGNHNLSVGVNFRHNNITDNVFQERTGSNFPLVETFSADSFASGVWDVYQQRFSLRDSQPYIIYSFGFYAQDQWKVTPRLTLTLALRGDRNSNPKCSTNCFSTAPSNFESLDHSITTPYNQALVNGQSNAFHSLEAVAWQPRLGFAYTPWANGNTVVRGGIGLFADIPPGSFAEFFSRNTPQQNSFTVAGLNASPAVADNAQAAATGANAALVGTYNSGGTVSDLQAGERAAGVASLTLPNEFFISKNVTNPKYLKYNLELQQGIGTKTMFSINYNGNYGYDIFVNNPGLNAFCLPARCGAAVNGFPSTQGPLSTRQSPVDGRFGTITEYSNSGISHYNGVTFSLQHRLSTLQLAASYTWSHSTDDVSNGGLNPYSGNDSLLGQIDPHCLRCQNYGNSDYDVRHYIQAHYTWSPRYNLGNKVLESVLGGWSLTNTYFFRTGLPFSIYDSTLSGTIRYYGADLLVNLPNGPFHCGAPGPSRGACFEPFRTPTSGDLGSYIATNGLDDPSVGVASNQRRNQNRGPNYFDSDISLTKNFKLAENVKLGVGINAFNFLNHPNFANPINDIGNGGPNVTGSVLNTISPPTSPFGAFAGASASGRVVQLNARFSF